MSAKIKQNLENSIRSKIGLKSSSFISEEAALMKCFKYYDIAGKGLVTFDQWIKSIEKIGIIVPSVSDLKILFDQYDTDNDGKINYKDFISSILSPKTKSELHQDNLQFVNEHECDQAEEIIVDLRLKLATRGIRGIFHLMKEFKKNDLNNTRMLNFQEFMKSFLNLKIDISESEAFILFKSFDVQKCGYISYFEFIRILRGLMNESRTKQVINVYNILEKRMNKGEKISYYYLKAMFSAESHPDYMNKRRSKEEIIQELIEILEIQHSIFLDKEYNDIMSQEEFVDFYSNISLCCPTDDYFLQVIHSAWNIPLPYPYRPYSIETENSSNKKLSPQKGMKNASSNDNPLTKNPEKVLLPHKQSLNSPAQIYSMLRKKLGLRGPRGIIGLLKILCEYSEENSFKIQEDSLFKVFKEYRLDITSEDLFQIINDVDPNRSGHIPFLAIVEKIRGNITPFRKSLIDLAFKKLDKYNKGSIEVDFFKNSFCSRNHPEVKSGRKNENEILSEFLETFELHHMIFSSLNNDFISQDEFHEYFENVSSSIEEDSIFEQYMVNCWKLMQENMLIQPPTIKQNDPYKGYDVNKFAPFGTSQLPIDYSTSLRPKTNQKVFPQKEVVPAGYPTSSKFDSRYTPGKYNIQAKNIISPENYGNNPNDNSQILIAEQFRSALIPRGARGFVGLWKLLLSSPKNNTGLIDFKSFVSVIKSYRLKFSEENSEKLFKVFDIECRRLISISVFMKTIIGEMNMFRRNIVLNIFKRLDIQSKNIIGIEEIKLLFVGNKHPEVLIGKKTEDEVISEFLDVLDLHHLLVKGDSSVYIGCEEFLSLYNIFSRTIEDDKIFESLVKNSWLDYLHIN